MKMCSFFLSSICSDSYILLHHNYVSESKENNITWSSLDSIAKDFYQGNEKTLNFETIRTESFYLVNI